MAVATASADEFLRRCAKTMEEDSAPFSSRVQERHGEDARAFPPVELLSRVLHATDRRTGRLLLKQLRFVWETWSPDHWKRLVHRLNKTLYQTPTYGHENTWRSFLQGHLGIDLQALIAHEGLQAGWASTIGTAQRLDSGFLSDFYHAGGDGFHFWERLHQAGFPLIVHPWSNVRLPLADDSGPHVVLSPLCLHAAPDSVVASATDSPVAKVAQQWVGALLRSAAGTPANTTLPLPAELEHHCDFLRSTKSNALDDEQAWFTSGEHPCFLREPKHRTRAAGVGTYMVDGALDAIDSGARFQGGLELTLEVIRPHAIGERTIAYGFLPIEAALDSESAKISFDHPRVLRWSQRRESTDRSG